MVVTWVKDLIFGKASYGVELVFRANEEFDYAIIETGLIKNKLEIVNREKGKSLDSLLNYKWKKDLPVFLTISQQIIPNY